MRRLAGHDRIQRFIKAISAKATRQARLYFTGGATAVLLGWRPSTIDVDILLVPEEDAVLRALPGIKEELEINVELACPSHFIPELPRWEERSLFIVQEGPLSFYHYDLYAQALSKIERGHALDLRDVREMVRRKLIDPPKIESLFQEIISELYRYPVIDAQAFERAVKKTLDTLEP